LESNGWIVKISPLFSDDYVDALYARKSRGWYTIKGYLKRLKDLLTVWKYDIIWIEKEIFPFSPAIPELFLKLIKKPYVADYDDALFHRYDDHPLAIIRLLLGKKIDQVMKYSSVVTAGNDYLADRARCSGAKRIEIIPTVIDLAKYEIKPYNKNPVITIGWIGSPSTSKYLEEVSSVIKKIKKKFNVRFVAVGANQNEIRDDDIEVIPWTEESEVSSIQSFDIGIMPLPDEPWERGKCGYKIIQYMACGLPVVASPVGVNTKIIQKGKNGFLARNPKEWETALIKLIANPKLRKQMGTNGRVLAEQEFSLQVQSPRLENILSDLWK
jgi:glycosyltransferase involved in cell wall biosynthesis